MSIYKLIIRPEAESDLKEAYEWYQNSVSGLGDEFLRCVDARFSLIIRSPEIFQIVYKDLRRCILRRFPYQIFYKIDENMIYIIAVLQAKRNPKKWKARKTI